MRPTLSTPQSNTVGLPAYSTDGIGPGVNNATQVKDSKAVGAKKSTSFFGKIFASKTAEEWNEANDELMFQRWGSSEGVTYQMVQRYWLSQRIAAHWQNLYNTSPKSFAKYLKKGYMEPIPTAVSELAVLRPLRS